MPFSPSMIKNQSRRQFLRTSAGFSAIFMMPGVWSCRRPESKKQSYDFETFHSERQLAPVIRVTPELGNFVQTYFDVKANPQWVSRFPGWFSFGLTGLGFGDFVFQNIADHHTLNLERPQILLP